MITQALARLATVAALALPAAEAGHAQQLVPAARVPRPPAPAEPPPITVPPERDRRTPAEVRLALAAYEDAWNRRDLRALAALHAERYDGINLDGQRAIGRDEWLTKNARLFDNLPREATLRLTGSVRDVADDVAVVHGTWQVVDGPRDAPATGSFLSVYVREGGMWQLASGLAAPRMAVAERAVVGKRR